jgi:hypothetical protein
MQLVYEGIGVRFPGLERSPMIELHAKPQYAPKVWIPMLPPISKTFTSSKMMA